MSLIKILSVTTFSKVEDLTRNSYIFWWTFTIAVVVRGGGVAAGEGDVEREGRVGGLRVVIER